MALFNKRRRDMEPIIAISVVIFLIASGAVVSLSLYGSYVDEGEDLPVAPGKKVEVYYTGSLYGYYDGEGALIFDTNVREHAENEDYFKIGGFNKTSFNKMSFTHGRGEMLRLFEDGLTGYKAGDTVRIKIDLGEGYISENIEKEKSFEIPAEQFMSVKDFEAIYDEYIVPGAGPKIIKTLYGWDAKVVYDSSKDKISITHIPEAGEVYELDSNEKNVHGSVKLKVNTVGHLIQCEYVVEVENAGEDYMLWVKTHSEDFYIYGEADSGKLKITNSPAAEGDIYFVVTIASVS